MFDPVRHDEARFDRNSQKALKRQQSATERHLETAKDEVAAGRWDSDIANYFDGEMLMRIARRAANGEAQNPSDMAEIRAELEDYAADMAERKALRDTA